MRQKEEDAFFSGGHVDTPGARALSSLPGCLAPAAAQQGLAGKRGDEGAIGADTKVGSGRDFAAWVRVGEGGVNEWTRGKKMLVPREFISA